VGGRGAGFLTTATRASGTGFLTTATFCVGQQHPVARYAVTAENRIMRICLFMRQATTFKSQRWLGEIPSGNRTINRSRSCRGVAQRVNPFRRRHRGLTDFVWDYRKPFVRSSFPSRLHCGPQTFLRKSGMGLPLSLLCCVIRKPTSTVHKELRRSRNVHCDHEPPSSVFSLSSPGGEGPGRGGRLVFEFSTLFGVLELRIWSFPTVTHLRG
jgi:hypothetical protein